MHPGIDHLHRSRRVFPVRTADRVQRQVAVLLVAGDKVVAAFKKPLVVGSRRLLAAQPRCPVADGRICGTPTAETVSSSPINSILMGMPSRVGPPDTTVPAGSIFVASSGILASSSSDSSPRAKARAVAAPAVAVDKELDFGDAPLRALDMQPRWLPRPLVDHAPQMVVAEFVKRAFTVELLGQPREGPDGGHLRPKDIQFAVFDPFLSHRIANAAVGFKQRRLIRSSPPLANSSPSSE